MGSCAKPRITKDQDPESRLFADGGENDGSGNWVRCSFKRGLRLQWWAVSSQSVTEAENGALSAAICASPFLELEI